MEPSTLRLFRYRPTSPSSDAKLRTLVAPHLMRQPGIVAVFAGRAGPGAERTRLLASMWASRAAMDEALGVDGEAGGHPEFAGSMDDGHVDVFSVAFALPPECARDVGILRLVQGRARVGCLDAYLREASAGTASDRAAGVGPQALYLAVDPPDRFLTLSLWDEWAHVEAATGADLASAERTRHAELLEAWSAEHFEVIPGLAITTPTRLDPQPA